MSLFVWYFGTNRHYEDVPHHTMVLGPRYEELLKDIFNRKHLSEDFSLYLHRPSANDPSLAPEGCDAFYVLSPVPNLKSGTDWSQQAEPYRQAIEKRLEDTMMPGLGEEHCQPARADPAGLSGPAELDQRRGLLAGAEAVSERLVPPPQHQPGSAQSVPRRCRHASGRWRARRHLLGTGARQGRAIDGGADPFVGLSAV
jgi:hypothetical protein